MTRPRVLLGLAGLLGALPMSAASAQTMRTFSVTRAVAAESALRVTLDFGGGTVIVGPAPDSVLYSMVLRYDADRSEPMQQFDPRSGTLHLGMASTGGMGVRVVSREQLRQQARIALSPDVPLHLAAVLDASDATLDLGGTTLATLEVRATATRTAVDFSRPTRGTCTSARFTVGAGQLVVRRLAQSGCAALEVDGGAGSATLRFDGAWREDMQLAVRLAVGTLTLALPGGTGVRITGDRFLAPFASRGFIRDGDGWTTPGYARAPHRLSVELNASMVGIAVEWIAPR